MVSSIFQDIFTLNIGEGRWTHFDEHIFQGSWFNHQLEKETHKPRKFNGSSPLKSDAKGKMTLSFWGLITFQGRTLKLQVSKIVVDLKRSQPSLLYIFSENFGSVFGFGPLILRCTTWLSLIFYTFVDREFQVEMFETLKHDDPWPMDVNLSTGFAKVGTSYCRSSDRDSETWIVLSLGSQFFRWNISH